MCAKYGPRIEFSHAYYYQGNGKAERTGREIKEMLQRVCENGETWVEMLPSVRRVYHDTPGPTGLSPYEIVYGRQRHEAGPPFEGVTAEAAIEWFNKRRDSLNKGSTRTTRNARQARDEPERTKRSPPSLRGR